MKIVNVTGQDTGNQSYLLSKAINECTPHQSISFVRKAPLGWPSDVLYRDEWQRPPNWICNYWKSADVIHLHRWIRKSHWCKSKKGAGWVYHQHGLQLNMRLRQANFDADKRRNALRVVSTLNLMPFVDWNIERWFPRPIYTFVRKDPKLDGPLLICHSPTVVSAAHRERKGTDKFISVMEKLQQRYDVDYEIVSGVLHGEVMVRKARADILFDQLTTYFGTNALEAWALGIPVIAGPNNETHDFFQENLGEVPYARVWDEDSLYAALERLIVDREYRLRMSDLGWEYVNKYHNPKYCASLAIRAYREAIKLQS
jgi:hypothetical protein